MLKVEQLIEITMSTQNYLQGHQEEVRTWMMTYPNKIIQEYLPDVDLDVLFLTKKSTLKDYLQLLDTLNNVITDELETSSKTPTEVEDLNFYIGEILLCYTRMKSMLDLFFENSVVTAGEWDEIENNFWKLVEENVMGNYNTK